MHEQPAQLDGRLDDQLDDLLSDLCEGTISPQDFARLEELLRTDAALRKQYIRMMELHADLAWSDGALMVAGGINEKQNAHARPLHRIIGLSSAAAIVLVGALILLLNRPSTPDVAPHVATLTSTSTARLADAADAGGAHAYSALLPGRVVQLEAGSVDVKFNQGATTTLTGSTALRIESAGSATLLHGKVTAAVPPAAVGFTIDTPSLRVVDLGTRFGINIPGKGDTQVHVFEGSVEVHSRARLPRVFINFDDPASTRTLFSSLPFRLTGGVKHTQGIIGKGAAQFQNLPDDKVHIGGNSLSREEQPPFAVRDGITIEAMILPRWTGKGWSNRTPANPDGKPYDYDQIFRKEDGIQRILLCFQDDDGAKQPVVPSVDPGPCLTFGLYLEGIGYHELDMRLDGLAGRPTLDELKDGKPHHVVATYDAATGIKAIYIDGTLRFRHAYPAGTRIVAGGSAPGIVGNSDSNPHEAFNGVIDEFAFYDVALTPAEIISHWRQTQLGRNYFGATHFITTDGHTHTPVIPLGAGEAATFDATSGLRQSDIEADEKVFSSAAP